MAVEPVRLRNLAAALGRAWEGDGEVRLSGVAALEDAGPGDLAFARGPRFAAELAKSRAGAVILPPGMDAGGRPALRSPQPQLDFARAVSQVLGSAPPAPGVDPSARVAKGARVDPSARVGPLCALGEEARVGPRSVLEAGAILYADAWVGADCVIHARCVLREGTRVGDRVILQPGVVLGGCGFGYVPDEAGRHVKVPQLGRVVVEDDVEIGANSAVDRAALGETRIRRGTKIDDLVLVAHGCDVGPDAILAGQVGLGGGTVVEEGALLMGQAGASGHLRVGARAYAGPQAGITRDVPAGARVWGTPYADLRRAQRAAAALLRLPDLLRRMRAVERRLGLRARPEREEG